MTRHEPFSYKSSAELLKKSEDLGLKLPFQESINLLFEKVTLGSRKLPNRMAVQPMEGFDAESDGSPSELTFRRYCRYGRGGSSLIWFEATSVVQEGRSNPHQLMITSHNVDDFKRLVEKTRSSASSMFRSQHEIFLVLQLTHSGRYSQPERKPKPKVACINHFLDEQGGNAQVISDEELEQLQEKYVDSARLAGEAGFDAVDIKACHGYLINDLLAAFTRDKSRYGGSFQNRTFFLREVVDKIRSVVPGIILAVRLNAYDGIVYPYGFGVRKDGSLSVDLTEPKSLIRKLIRLGCSLFNVTAGNPFLKPHLGRPFDRPHFKASLPEEHPLEGVSRLLNIAGELQKEFPGIPFVGTGYSWLRHFFPNVAAAVVRRRGASFIGLGRSSFAYPDAVRDLMNTNSIDPKKVCITCSRCSHLMRHGFVSGCAVRDREVYGKEYRKLLRNIKR